MDSTGRGCRGGGTGAAVVFIAAVVAACGAACQTAGEQPAHVEEPAVTFGGVLTQHNDIGRTGANLAETLLTPASVRAGFGKLHPLIVDGQVQAQPLYAVGAVAGQDALIVATEKNSVYAFQPDTPWNILWQRIAIEPANFVPSPTCNNSLGPYGINSTPVIDPATSTLYVVTKTGTGSAAKFMLHALSLSDGTDKMGSPIDISTGATAPNPAGGTIAFSAANHQNRVALTLNRSVLSIGFGSYCDHDPYHGWVLRFNVATSPVTPLTHWVTTPATSRGSIWMGGAGFSADAADTSGTIYFTTGNGPPMGTVTNTTSLGNSFVKLAGSVSAAPSVADFFMPADVATQDTIAVDSDVGSAGPLLIPNTSFLVGGGKNGVFYVLNRNSMGQFMAVGPPEPQIQQRFSVVGAANSWIVGSPVFWDAPAGPMVYVWPGKTKLEQYQFDRTAGKFTPVSAPAPVHVSSDPAPTGDAQGGFLSISANGSTTGTGIVWATHALASTGGGATVAGALYAFDAENVATKLFDSTARAADNLASASKYNAPTVANGKVYVPTFSGEVDVYGLLAGPPPDAGPPDAPVDAAPAPPLTCATVVDPGPAQPTTWAWVYSTYFGPGSTGHCANCHPGAPGTGLGGFGCGATADSCYAGLVAVGLVDPNNGAGSKISQTDLSPLVWFGGLRSLPVVPDFMPKDHPAGDARDARAVAALCGWVQAGAPGVACTSPQVACGQTCFDLGSDSTHCGTCATACATGTTCQSGKCCATGLTNCNGTCVDLTASPNCGACGVTCTGGKVCSSGACRGSAGQACVAGTDCASTFCVDSVCCGSVCSGTCTACSQAKTGQPDGMCANANVGTADARCTTGPVCGNTGLCAANASCQLQPATHVCVAASCTGGVATAATNCNGSGTCPTPVTSSCAPFACGTTACKTTCAADTDCATGNFCSGTACVAKRTTGTACTAATQCASNSCSSDGVCCGSACGLSCQGCTMTNTGLTTGTCGPRLMPAGTAVCNNACVNINTDPANCGACGTVCGTGKVCANRQCLLANSQACTTGMQCGSSFCVDGFCCDGACSGACTACSMARTGVQNGMCAAIPSGTADARCTTGPVCGNTGLCAANGACQLQPATKVCVAASCTGGVATAAANCNGSGVCATPVTTSCSPFTCGTTACKTTCAADSDCVAGDFCSGTTCVARRATGSACAAANQCASNFCSSDGVCCGSACGLSCQGCTMANTGVATGTCGVRLTPAGTAVCNNACVNINTDPANCGACGTVCPTGMICSNKQCVNAGGQACTTGSQCASTFCVDGFCCDSACTGACTACSNARTGVQNGMCAPIPSGTADARCTTGPVCGNTGVCAANGACQQQPATKVCVAASCTGGVATAVTSCNGSGACPAPVTTSCAPYTCGTTACKTTCAADTDCAAGNFCSGTVCVARKAIGVACAAANQCTSNFCSSDGVCCSGSCGLSCQGCTSANTGLATGTCGPRLTPPGTAVCNNACVNTQADPANCGGCGLVCAAGQTCTGGRCLSPTGAACTTPAQCASGSCVDGFCCNTACTALCNACSNARTGAPSGTCAPVMAGAPDARCVVGPVCGNTGVCAAGGVCQLAPASTVCAPASCTNGAATAAATCTGSGACGGAATTSCAPFICGATACNTSCAVDTDCIAGDFCSGATCVLRKGTGATCAAARECASGFCSSDGVCCSGSCGLSCQGCTSANTGLTTGTCGPRLTPAGTAVCNNACVNTQTDPANCGGCGVVCAAGATCSAGACSAPACTTTNALIDNFEDGNNQVALLESRNGPLYTIRDNLGTTITPAVGTTFVPATGGNGGSARAAHITGQIANTSPVWAGFALDFLAPQALYNASKYTGVTFFAKKGTSTAASAMRIKVPDRNTDPVGHVCTTCNNDFGNDLTLTTSWQQFTVRFSTMTQQAGWGAPRPAHIDPTGLLGLKFQLETKGAAFDVWIDDVQFICN